MTDIKFTRLEDYVPFPFLIPEINLEFFIEEDFVRVINTMKIIPMGKDDSQLILRGVHLELEEIFINNIILEPILYSVDSQSLKINNIQQEPFELKTICKINPYTNTSLEGLYLSGDILTTQCEAEGFRRISFHPDRPDVLSKYKVCIEAEHKKFPVVLSNGNLLSSKFLQNNSSRKQVLWEDPFPKPSYLFALVAGQLEEVNSEFKTKSGKIVLIRLHIEKGDEKYTSHAITSLKRAMSWDEEVYGLEYDLNEYNIVAIRHFNMGAMENKSLNIFNSKLVLADSKIATDFELERIESVVAHEYFHNWTGNRITCRDWFQLSLKEGLTVFRDQSFTSDLHSSAVKRISDVSLLRNAQFIEDAGPTSHAVKPSKYLSIDNFYTTTIYEKGAELVRMLNILLGNKVFMEGMKFYVDRFDGKPATTDDFVDSIIQGANLKGFDINFDIDQFKLWYSQPGTPKVTIEREWDPIKSILTLNFSQSNKSTNKDNKPHVIPISLALIGSNGRIGNEKLFILSKIKQKFVFQDIPAQECQPTLSIFRGFSAPVNWEIDYSLEEYLQLFSCDDDPFSRWEAGQGLIRQAILLRSLGIPNVYLEECLVSSFRKNLLDDQINDKSFLASLLSFPKLPELEIAQELADPLKLNKSIFYLKSLMGKKLSSDLYNLISKSQDSVDFKWPLGQGERRLLSLAWEWLVASGQKEIRKDLIDVVVGDSMTLARAALLALLPIDCLERKQALQMFYDRWKDRPVILDNWFYLEASSYRSDSIERIKELMGDSRFDCLAPNSYRAVLGGLASNTEAFHSLDGSGYLFMAEQIAHLDGRNPITASRLVKVFNRWRSYVKPHREKMLDAIRSLEDIKLSNNTREVVELMLTTESH